MKKEESAADVINLKISKWEVKHSNHALDTCLKPYKNFANYKRDWTIEQILEIVATYILLHEDHHGERHFIHQVALDSIRNEQPKRVWLDQWDFFTIELKVSS